MGKEREVSEASGLAFSESVENIAPAFLAVQKDIEDPPRTGHNPHFGSAYVTLEDLVHAVRPVLSEHGLTLIQAPGRTNGEVTVETMLLHESGEWARFTCGTPTQRDDPQGVGSAITYLRRYSLASMLGLVHEADDDGNRASPRPASKGATPASNEGEAASDGHTCPECGGPIWDNRADKEAGEVSKKYPNFKCRDKECDWASWDSEDEVFGTEEGYDWADDVKDAADPDTVREIENVLIELAAPFPDYARRAQERFDDLKAEGKLTQQKAEDALRQFREKLDEASEDDGPDKDEWDDRSDVLMWFENQYGDEWEAKLNLFLSRHPDLSTPHEKLDRMSWNRIKRFVDEHDRDGVEDPRQVLQTEAAL